MSLPPHWCSICGKDLQSARSLAEHEAGRKHRRRAGLPVRPRRRWAPLTEEELFDGLAAGQIDSPPSISQSAACSCDAGMAAYASCEKCEITRKRGNTVAKFLGLIPKRPPQAPAVEHRVHAG